MNTHIDWETVGHITLRISFFVYLFFFVPQIIHNIKRNSVQGLSFRMHLILFTAFICDFGYGIGRQMEWEYCLVSFIGILSLLLQHSQFKVLNTELPKYYYLITVLLILLFGLVAGSLIFDLGNRQFYTGLGFVATAGWLTYTLPQIHKNFTLKSILGLSLGFILLGLCASLCDTVSAYALDWGLPNKIGAPISSCLKLIILFQFSLYSNNKIIK